MHPGTHNHSPRVYSRQETLTGPISILRGRNSFREERLTRASRFGRCHCRQAHYPLIGNIESSSSTSQSNDLTVRNNHPLRYDHDAVANVKAVAVDVWFFSAIVDRYAIADSAVFVEDRSFDMAVISHIDVGNPFAAISLAL